MNHYTTFLVALLLVSVKASAETQQLVEPPCKYCAVTADSQCDVATTFIDDLDEFLEDSAATLLESITVLLCSEQPTVPSSIGQLTSLTSFTYRLSNFSHVFPSQMGLLTKLESFVVTENKILTFPSEVLEMNLTRLQFSNNGAAGSIPPQIGILTRLTSLQINGNELTDVIPSSIGELSLLETLSMQDNMLSGTIPASLSNLQNLGLLNLGQNGLTGSMEESADIFKSLPLLFFLDLANNQLSGPINMIAEIIGPIEWLDLQDNEITGTLPTQVGGLLGLKSLALSGNNIDRDIPSELGLMKDLVLLELQSNSLDGAIPKQIGSLTNLETLRLNDNELTGLIPPSFVNLTQLEYCFIVGTNDFWGEVPGNLLNTVGGIESDIFEPSFPSASPTPGIQETEAPTYSETTFGYIDNYIGSTDSVPRGVLIAFGLIAAGFVISCIGVYHYRPHTALAQETPLKIPTPSSKMAQETPLKIPTPNSKTVQMI